MHSPLEGNRLFLPFGPDHWGDVVLDPDHRWDVIEFFLGYVASAALLYAWSFLPTIGPPIEDGTAANH